MPTASTSGAWVSRLIPVTCAPTLPNGKAICEGRTTWHWLGDSFAVHVQPNGTQLELYYLTHCLPYHVDDAGQWRG